MWQLNVNPKTETKKTKQIFCEKMRDHHHIEEIYNEIIYKNYKTKIKLN